MKKLILTAFLAIFSSYLMGQDLKVTRNKDCDCYGYKDSKGNLVIPYKYSFALDFTEGMAAVRADGKSGFINKDDKAVIPLMYEWAEAFGEGLAAVQLDGKWGFINKNGKQVIPFIYQDARVFHEGLVKVKLNKKWGFIDHVGKVIVQPVYDRVDDFREGMAAVAPVMGAGYGYINKDGKMVIPVQYKFVYSFSDGVAMVSTDKGHYHIDKNGKVLDGEDKMPEKTPSAELACEEASEKMKYPASAGAAIKVLRKYDATGNMPMASYYLAKGFAAGQVHSLKKEIDSAMYYCQKAADKGFKPAFYFLGQLYQCATGTDVPMPTDRNRYAYLIDKKKARYWYNEAAKTGNIWASQKIELMDKAKADLELKDAYSNGYTAFTDKNFEEAYRWWKLSAFEANDADAYYGLAALHHLGKAPNADYNKAIEYYDKAAALGKKEALAEKQKVLDYLAALEAYRKRAATASTTTTAKTGESYGEWWEKTYGRGGTQNSRPMPNYNTPQATYRTGSQSESDRHQRAMDQIYRDSEKQMKRGFKYN